jgi:hypothetical protein
MSRRRFPPATDVRAFFSEEKKKEHVSRIVAVRRSLMEHLVLKQIAVIVLRPDKIETDSHGRAPAGKAAVTKLITMKLALCAPAVCADIKSFLNRAPTLGLCPSSLTPALTPSPRSPWHFTVFDIRSDLDKAARPPKNNSPAP